MIYHALPNSDCIDTDVHLDTKIVFSIETEMFDSIEHSNPHGGLSMMDIAACCAVARNVNAHVLEFAIAVKDAKAEEATIPTTPCQRAEEVCEIPAISPWEILKSMHLSDSRQSASVPSDSKGRSGYVPPHLQGSISPKARTTGGYVPPYLRNGGASTS